MDNTDRNDITELIYAISNIAHAEYHLIELLMINKDIIPKDLPKAVAEMRSIRVNLMNILQELRSNVGPLWCPLKHLFLTEMHLFELYEKENNYKYIKEAQRIHLLIDDLLGIEGLDEFKSCPRCSSDKKEKNYE